MIEIIGIGDNGKLIVEVQNNELKLITGENREFDVGEQLEVSSLLSVIHQLSRKKTKFVVGLGELANIIDQL